MMAITYCDVSVFVIILQIKVFQSLRFKFNSTKTTNLLNDINGKKIFFGVLIDKLNLKIVASLEAE